MSYEIHGTIKNCAEEKDQKMINFIQYIDANRGIFYSYHKFSVAEISLGDYNFRRWTSKTTEYYSVNSKRTCKPPELHTIMKKCNGTGLVLKICETKNNVWKRCGISIQNSIDNGVEITKIKLDHASLNDGLKCRKPVFMRAFGIRFIK